MEIFIAPLLATVAIVTLICAAIVRSNRYDPKDPTYPARREEERRRRMERQQERFYRQQSFRFWHDLFNGKM